MLGSLDTPRTKVAVPLLSIVVPCFNEEPVVARTHRRLKAASDGWDGIDVEAIFVDDGSSDGTLAVLRELAAADSALRVVSLSRNFGQQIAITAGLAAAKGDAAVVLDCDLQDPPEVIHEMLARWREGAEVVFGRRLAREGEGAVKRWRSKAFFRFFNRISDIFIPAGVGEFCLMDRKVIDVLMAMPERHRFLRGMVPWSGFRQEVVPFRREPRAVGKSKWRFRATLGLALGAVLSFGVAPLRLAIWLGFLVAGGAVVGIFYALAQRLLTDVWVPGWATIFIAVLFIGGAQLVVVGMLGEYLGRIYAEVKRRPLYVVKERLGFPPEPVDAGHAKSLGGHAADGTP